MKPLLIFYLNIDNLHTNEIEPYSNSVFNTIGDLRNDYRTIVIPVRNQPTKVECVNPIIIPTEYYEKYKLNLTTKITCKLKEIGKIRND